MELQVVITPFIRGNEPERRREEDWFLRKSSWDGVPLSEARISHFYEHIDYFY